MADRLSEEVVRQQARYWLESSRYDLSASHKLVEAGTYVWALFTGHIALEKVLKAVWVSRTKTAPPRTHNLLVLAKGAGVSLSEQDRAHLATINRFNIEARYPSVKLDFYTLCDRQFATTNLDTIDGLYNELSGELAD